MKEPYTTYFKEFTATNEKNLKQFNEALTPKEFSNLYKMAKEAYKDTPHAEPFDSEQVFISGENVLNGFYFPNNSKTEARTGYKLLLIAFKIIHHYNFKTHKKDPDTLEALPIYTDGQTNYTLKTYPLNLRPLEDWQRQLKNSIKDCIAKIEGWQKVKRIYKKDGKPFANIDNNFDGVKVVTVSDTYEKKEYRLNLCVGDSLTSFRTSDTVYSCDDAPLNGIEDIIPAIKRRVGQLNSQIAETKQKLNLSKKIYLDIIGPYTKTILKYSTPTNRDGVECESLRYDFYEIFKNIYI